MCDESVYRNISHNNLWECLCHHQLIDVLIQIMCADSALGLLAVQEVNF